MRFSTRSRTVRSISSCACELRARLRGARRGHDQRVVVREREQLRRARRRARRSSRPSRSRGSDIRRRRRRRRPRARCAREQDVDVAVGVRLAQVAVLDLARRRARSRSAADPTSRTCASAGRCGARRVRAVLPIDVVLGAHPEPRVLVRDDLRAGLGERLVAARVIGCQCVLNSSVDGAPPSRAAHDASELGARLGRAAVDERAAPAGAARARCCPRR